MYRYVALIWDKDNPHASADARVAARRLREASADWSLLVEEPGLMAFHADAGGGGARVRKSKNSCESRVLTGRCRGVLFGRLFRLGKELESHDADEPLGAAESHAICDTEGRHLIENYWGRYVGVFRHESGCKVSVLRDPTGGLPCFITNYKDIRIVFSDVESCLSLGLLTFSINWKYIASVVPYSALQIRETGLNEVVEVQQGERLTIEGEITTGALLWKPFEIAARNRIVDPAQARAEVREMVQRCVNAWASLHHSVLHTLSGGLDSSIVLGCIKSAPNNPRVACVHYYFTPASNEDEREYARLVARHMGTELLEFALDPADARLERLHGIRPTPKPWFYIYDLIHGPIEARVSDERDATCAFSGAGGDGLFVQARADLAVADYLRHAGFRPGVFRVALDAARINRASIWPTLRRGLLQHWKPSLRDMLAGFSKRRTVIPAEVFDRARDDESLIHPWISKAEGITPGLLWQLLSLSVPTPFYDSFGAANAVERTPALVSQPLMELCLRIPSYVWITGGRDRSIARRAFSDVLPQAVVRRTQKGLIDRYNRQMLDENVTFLRDMLLDGLLVNAGLLDRDMLERYMDPVSSPASFEYNEVLRQHLCTEIWLRRWTALTTSSAR